MLGVKIAEARTPARADMKQSVVDCAEPEFPAFVTKCHGTTTEQCGEVLTIRWFSVHATSSIRDHTRYAVNSQVLKSVRVSVDCGQLHE